MAGHNAGNDQRKSRSNRAASFINANGDVGQSENNVIPNYWNTQQRETDVHSLGGAMLKKHNDGMKQAGRKGNHAKKEQETKGKFSTCTLAIAEDKNSPDDND